jgi:hypothetical protein
MNREQALEKLQVSPDADMAAVETAYLSRRQDLSDRIDKAPTDDLRRKYLAMLQEVEAAYKLAGDRLGGGVQVMPPHRNNAAITPLSATKMADLPSGTPSMTQALPELSVVGLSSGRVLMTRYELLRMLGSGGMGEVWAAKDLLRGQEVAVKAMLPALTRSEDGRRRFLQEAQAALTLAHPGIVRVFDVHEDGGLAFLTMELLQGHSLRELMDVRAQQGATVSIAEIVRIASFAAQALEYCSQRGNCAP